MQSNPYPQKVAFSDAEYIPYQKIGDLVPYYFEWQSIKNDSRWLQLPKHLKNELDSLNNVLIEYNEVIFSAAYKVGGRAKQIITVETKEPVNMNNSVGFFLLPIIISKNKEIGSLIHCYPLHVAKDLPTIAKNILEWKIYDECNNLNEIKKLKHVSNRWKGKQKN